PRKIDGESIFLRRSAAGNLAAETLDALEIVRSMRREAFFAERYRALQRKIGELDVRLYALGQMPRLVLESAAFVGVLALFGAMLALDVPGETILLDFAALVAVLSRMLPAFSRLHYNFVQIRQHQAVAEDFCREMETNCFFPRFPAPDDFDFDGSFELRGIRFRYGESAPLFDGFDLAVAAGECVGVTGRTGCGKSALLALLLGFVEPEKGGVFSGGRDLADHRDGFLRRVGFVPQRTVLFDDTVRGNLTLGEAIPDAELHTALKRARLDDCLRHFPGGLDGRIEHGGGNLSGGQKQRLAIARALCRKDVRLLLLDEPTSALDAMTESEFSETLGSLRGKITMLVVSHREAALRACDRVISLDDRGNGDNLRKKS
ncbi:MAG: ABC transporter ATP-binding protein/permease, partial [Victivallaceae bacterium]|nr:ABC transporter ATP-binding protein/permease [Victivallaceae bacterium]